jgi:hypothetical protein
LGKITAAAVTGPAKQPLPASSVPVSKLNPEKFFSSISFFVLIRKYYKIFFKNIRSLTICQSSRIN